MKILPPINESYSATVVTINETHPLENLDNLVGTNFFGFQVLISKDTPVGTRGIFFTPETQLSNEFAEYNNLYRNKLKNKLAVEGYLEDNARVRALRLRGNVSSGIFLPLSSLDYIKGLPELKDGTVFDTLGDHQICNKYVTPRRGGEPRVEKNKKVTISRVDKQYLPEHYSTDQWYRHHNQIEDDTPVIITQKLHGTSIRIGNTIVARKLTLRDKLAAKIGVVVLRKEFDYVFGSKRVIKDINNPNQNHYYTTDIWTEEGKKLEGVVPENFLIYGELLGWTPNNTPIQKNYTYQIPKGEAQLYVYRVAFVNGQGLVIDLTWDQVVEFCRDRGLKTVPELWRGRKGDIVLDSNNLPYHFMDKKFREDGYQQAVPLDPESPVDEGICVRVDGIAPYILKAKGPLFYEHETKMKDEQAEDLEEDENAQA